MNIIKKEAGKTVLIISHDPDFKILRNHLYDKDAAASLGKMKCIKMPTRIISNELDKRILAALHDA